MTGEYLKWYKEHAYENHIIIKVPQHFLKTGFIMGFSKLKKGDVAIGNWFYKK